MTLRTTAGTVARLASLPLLLVSAPACDNEAIEDDNLASPVTTAADKTPGEHATPPTLDDDEIQAAVERELFYDPIVAREDIGVEVKSGIVQLTGSAEHLLAKSRASHIASSVKGVRAISNRLKVNVAKRDDALIKQGVVGAIAIDPTTERADITADVKDQVVTLSGTVQSHPEKVWAERAAKTVAGVKEVKNNLAVEYRSARRDAEILEDVEARLRWDSVINDGLIDASVANGYVTLRGVIATLAEKERAESNAWVNGVKGVDTRQLEVKWWAKDEDLRKDKYVTRSDREIESALEDALLFDPRVNSFTITPKVSGARATLQGTVSSLAAKQAAGQIATGTVGVVKVENNIEIDPGSVMDPALETRLERALAHNTFTEAREIEVDVDQAIAKLRGTVDNFAEKSEAEIVAQSVPGIKDVENELVVATPIAFVLEIDGYYPNYPYVAPWASRVSSVPLKTDLETKQDIERELSWSPYVAEQKVEVEVDNGVATLTGSGLTPRDQAAAVANAYQGGAVKVVNELTLM